MENQAITQRPNERDIQKRFNSRNAISSGILIVIGVFMVSLTLTMHTTDSNILSLVLMVCGGSMAIYGMIRILSHASRTVYAPTGSTIKEYHLYYSPEHFDTLQHIIGANGVPECIPVSQADNTTVRLDILMSEDKKFARLQLLKYENYIFHPATDMFFYSTPEAGRIHELITNHRKQKTQPNRDLTRQGSVP